MCGFYFEKATRSTIISKKVLHVKSATFSAFTNIQASTGSHCFDLSSSYGRDLLCFGNCYRFNVSGLVHRNKFNVDVIINFFMVRQAENDLAGAGGSFLCIG